jgi:SOS-response transcriptional repressor LexA
MKLCHNFVMEEPKDRLKQAMVAAGYPTPTEAAKAFKSSKEVEINKNTLTSHCNGNRPLSRKAAERYAKAFGVSAGWLLFDDQEEAQGDIEIPVLSIVNAGALRDQPGVSGHDVESWVKVSDLPKGDWVGLEVEGDSMDRIAPNGSIILVNRADTRLIDGRFYVFSLGCGAATFKRWRRDPERLQPYSTNPDHISTPVDDGLFVFGRARRVIIDI